MTAGISFSKFSVAVNAALESDGSASQKIGALLDTYFMVLREDRIVVCRHPPPSRPESTITESLGKRMRVHL